MGNTYATAGLASNQFAGNLAENAVCASNVPSASPVLQAITDLQQQIGECRYSADEMIGAIGSVLRGEPPETNQRATRPAMASELAETIQQMADGVRAIRHQIADARERLTL